MKILFFGDSITDAGRDKVSDALNSEYGIGFVMQAAGRLFEKDFNKYEIVNRGISGNRIVDMYARIKSDCWNFEPDVINILAGVNDVGHDVKHNNGVEIDRFETVYRMLLADTKKRLPNAKIILCEPFVLKGTSTEELYDKFLLVREYAKVVKKLSDEFGTYFLPIQKIYDEIGEKYGNETIFYDGIHPNTKGAVVLATEWLKLFEKVEESMK